MPFPTVAGKTFQEDLETIKNILGPVVLPLLPESSGKANELWLALNRMFIRVDAVSTQLYDDVQKLKALENERATLPSGGFGSDKHTLFPESDPSQKPIP